MPDVDTNEVAVFQQLYGRFPAPYGETIHLLEHESKRHLTMGVHFQEEPVHWLAMGWKGEQPILLIYPAQEVAPLYVVYNDAAEVFAADWEHLADQLDQLGCPSAFTNLMRVASGREDLVWLYQLDM